MRTGKKHLFGLLLAIVAAQSAWSQRLLSLDSCLNMAIDNNRKLCAAKMKEEATRNLKKSARTKYLPHVQAIGGYFLSSKEISILNDGQKEKLQNVGNIAAQLNPQLAPLAPVLNAEGQGIVDAFHTDTRQTIAATVMVSQPIYMGGSITAANRIADINEEMAANSTEATRQNTIHQTEQAYWTVVSLKHKQKLAKEYLNLVKRLNNDIEKMIEEGVATRSEGLSVAVKLNEAEMTLTQVEDGLTLARMMLCQLCGLPLDEQLTLADENRDNLEATHTESVIPDKGASRPELKLLQNMVDVNRQTTRLIRSGELPKIALVGGYTLTNPNVYNGFQREFSGLWHVGVLVSIPVWNWGDVAYKVRASKNATAMAELDLTDAREKVELQISQSNFKMTEASKKLTLAQAGTKKAEENLRCATLGFHEGVIQTTTVMEAQTAWLQAQSQKIDAEIDLRLSRSNLRKAMGTLSVE